LFNAVASCAKLLLLIIKKSAANNVIDFMFLIFYITNVKCFYQRCCRLHDRTPVNKNFRDI
jgi:hypothetical protein